MGRRLGKVLCVLQAYQLQLLALFQLCQKLVLFFLIVSLHID